MPQNGGLSLFHAVLRLYAQRAFRDLRAARPVSDSVATQLERPRRPDGDSDDVGRSLLDELMTSSQVAALLQMRLSTVESYARRGLLPSVKVGRHRRFIRSEVERALTALVDGSKIYQPNESTRRRRAI